MKIFKYVLPIKGHITLELPKDAKILHADMQFEFPCIWALVDPESSTEMRHFRFAGTGHPIQEAPENLEYIGTFQVQGGALVFHLFEII